MATRTLRVLLLNHPELAAPRAGRGGERKDGAGRTEADVLGALRRLGHSVCVLHARDELHAIRAAIEHWRPHVVFNLLEEFAGRASFDQHLVACLELLGVPYTGCGPRGLLLARDKALAKTLVAAHGVRTPDFLVVPRGRAPRRPPALGFPLIVKSLDEESSLGLSQASVVGDERRLRQRVAFVHERVGSDALVEAYVAGREIYVGVLGGQRPLVLPVWELHFGRLAAGDRPIATERVKHDLAFQRRAGIVDRRATGLSAAQQRAITLASRRIVAALSLDGYSRLDFRLAPDGGLHFLEANANPEIARREAFARAARAAGLEYPALIQRLLDLGLRRERRR